MDLPNHVVVVCGHGIWTGGPRNGWDEREWLIESYKAGETPTFIEHIKAGLRVISEDDRGILVFSGYVLDIGCLSWSLSAYTCFLFLRVCSELQTRSGLALHPLQARPLSPTASPL